MNKASVFFIAATVAGLFTMEANAQYSYSPSTQFPLTAEEQPKQATGKQQISEEELPNGIKKALKSDVLTAWEVSEVYKVAGGEEETAITYEVYFVNAEQYRAFARYDAKGNTVKDAE